MARVRLTRRLRDQRLRRGDSRDERDPRDPREPDELRRRRERGEEQDRGRPVPIRRPQPRGESRRTGRRGARASRRSPRGPVGSEGLTSQDQARRAVEFERQFGAGELGRFQHIAGSDLGSDRQRLIRRLSADPLSHASRAQDFLAQSARGFANELMPDLQKGLQATRSRFGGGAIRSGGAQEGEERAFERLFSDPLQNRIAQLADRSLRFGQSEAQRGVENAMGLGRFDLARAGQAASVGGAARNRFLDALRGVQEQERFEEEEKRRRLEGAGSFVTGLVDAIVPF